MKKGRPSAKCLIVLTTSGIRYQVNENQFSKDYHERLIKIKELSEQMLEELRIMYDSYDKERDKYWDKYNKAYESMSLERKI